MMGLGWFESAKGFFSAGVHNSQDKFGEVNKDPVPDPSHGSWFDILVDAFSRLMRPGMTTWIIGGFVGWWPLPKVDEVSEYWQNIFLLIITFWFGGRAILRDLPAAVRMMRGK
jgi:hypothetical protein